MFTREGTHWGLTGVTLDLGVESGRSDILMVLNLSVHGRGVSLRSPSSATSVIGVL